MEETGQLKPRWSALEEDLEQIHKDEEADKIVRQKMIFSYLKVIYFISGC